MAVRPAEGVLAGALISESELDGVVDAVFDGVGRRDEGRRVMTGVKSLDEALGSGLGSGVVAVWGEVGGMGSEICRALLVSSLLGDPNSTAAVIDTTGNFDILRLYTLILYRLKKDSEVLESVRSAIDCNVEATVEDVAIKVLDLVKIMRVFDFVGLRDAMTELRDGLEGKPLSKEETRKVVAQDVLENEPGGVLEKEAKPKPKRTVVADSEDEEDEEMLFDIPPRESPRESEEETSRHRPGNATERDIEPPEQRHPEGPSLGKVKFILIDNLNQVLSPLLKKDYIQANTLASTFLQTLNHLTRTHDLHTVLANPAVYPKSRSPIRKPHDSPNQPPQPPRQESHQPPSPSIFASIKLVPSLMNLLSRYIDVGLLVSQLPKRKIDARVFYRDEENNPHGPGPIKKPRGVEMVNVLEVMSDRWDGRVGAWGTFAESDTGIKDVP